MGSLTKCPNGHMYDSSKTPQCPHCRGAGAAASSSTAAAEGFAANASATNYAPTGTGMGGGPSLTSAKTVAFQFQNTQSAPSGILKGSPTGASPLRSTPTMPGVFQQPAGPATAQDEGATPGAATPGSATAPGVFNPVVGWMIALTGPEKGRDYRLVVGKNTIGRDEGAHVRLTGDDQISRSHATIYYYPKVNEFYIEDHSSHGTYINGKPVIQRTLVANMDKIELAGITLLLRALCDSGFMWDEFK